jgi:hypothetical protein
MDEYNSGMDPEVRIYFGKIIRTFSWILLWLMAMITAGIFFRLGEINNGLKWYNVLFYFLSLVTFIMLLRRLFKIWNPLK